MADNAQGENRGRSDEARDPNRPIDPTTGEREGLGPRDPDDQPAADGSDDAAIVEDDAGNGA